LMTERRRQLLLLLAGSAFVGLAAISNSIWPLVGLLMLALLSVHHPKQPKQLKHPASILGHSDSNDAGRSWQER